MKLQKHSLFNPQTLCLTEQAMFDYIDGRLSQKECHQIEAHILDCAFCSDALEGLELMKDRRKIHSRLSEEAGPSKDRGFILPFNANIRLAAAAVIILLTGTWILFGYILNEEKSIQLAQKEVSKNLPVQTGSPASEEETFKRYYEQVPASEALAELSRRRKSTELFRDEAKTEITKEESALNRSDSKAIQTNDHSVTRPDQSIPAAPENKKPEAPPAEDAPAATDKQVDIDSDYSVASRSLSRKESRARKRNQAAAGSGQTAPAPQAFPAGNERQNQKDRTADAVENETQSPPAAVKENVPVKAVPAMPAPLMTSASGNTARTVRNEKQMSVKAGSKASRRLPKPARLYKSDSLLEAGLKAYDFKSYAVAINLFGEILRFEPRHETALLFMGFSCLNILPADTQKAMECFDKLTHSGNRNTAEEAKWFKSLTLVKESRKEEAKDLLTTLAGTKGAYSERAAGLLKDLQK